ncbi:MAG TPA: hypothetical protein DCP32_10705 [Anaerolineaceae bacterium]|nr:MAG: hypothetical protein A2X24_00995 [Chloroflexi bacterium GWB2_54_36]HAL17188.1 hypothetical protein [Anaerolineaceae bacterium]HBA92304.1 hypothetical protein [Anaerolineaceae bacterium]
MRKNNHHGGAEHTEKIKIYCLVLIDRGRDSYHSLRSLAEHPVGGDAKTAIASRPYRQVKAELNDTGKDR